MKKVLLFMFCCLLALVVACSRKEIKVCSGLVDRMSDTSIVTKIGDYSITFDTKKAKYTNGVVMPGDSVTIHYVGDLKEKHATAAIVYLIPPKGNVVNAVYDPNKELKTAPMSEEDAKNLDEFVKSVMKDRARGIK